MYMILGNSACSAMIRFLQVPVENATVAAINIYMTIIIGVIICELMK